MFVDENDPDWREKFQKLEEFFKADAVDDLLNTWSEDSKGPFAGSIFGRLRGKFTLSTVMDASSIVSIIWAKFKGKSSTLWDLVRSGAVECWAPFQLEKDLNGKFEELSRRLDLPLSSIEELWRKEIGPYVRIECGDAPLEVQTQLDAIQRRDPTDIEYVSLALTIGADGVFTTDKDIIEDGGVRILKFGDAVRIVSTYKRGRLATTIQFHTGALALVLFGGVAYGTFTLAKMLVRLASQLPWWAWAILAGGVGVLLLFERTRLWLLELLKTLKQWFEGIWESIKTAGLEVWRVWWPVLSASMKALTEAEVQFQENPHLGKRPKRRKHRPSKSAEIERLVVERMKRVRKPVRPSELLRRMFPRVSACNLSAIRQNVYRKLRSHPRIKWSRGGRYAWMAAST